MSARDAIRTKVAKLMALGNDSSANQFEAEAALRQAAYLMRKHNIEQAELMQRSPGTAYDWDTGDVPLRADGIARQQITWMGTLAVGIANFTDTIASCVWSDGCGLAIRFQGEATDVQYAVWLGIHLRDSVRSVSARHHGTRASRETFRRAMVRRLCERMGDLARARQTALHDTPVGASTALVAVDQKIAARDRNFEPPRYRTTRSRRDFEITDALAGQRAGDSVALNRPIDHSARPSLGHA